MDVVPDEDERGARDVQVPDHGPASVILQRDWIFARRSGIGGLSDDLNLGLLWNGVGSFPARPVCRQMIQACYQRYDYRDPFNHGPMMRHQHLECQL